MTPAALLAELTLPATQFHPPPVVALLGVPAAGKTTVAEHLAGRLPLLVLSTDAIRLRHALPSGLATNELILAAAPRLLARDVGLVLDGAYTFRRADRDRLRALAAAHGAPFHLVRVVVAPHVVLARLAARAADPAATTAQGKFVVTPERAAQIAAYVEPLGPDEPHLVVDSSAELGPQLAPLVRAIRELDVLPA